MTATLSPTSTRRGPHRERPASRRRRRGWGAVPFLAAAMVLYVVFLLYPIASAVGLSFYEWDGFATSDKVFVGVDNYVRLVTDDPVFWTAASNTMIWVVLSMLVPTVLGLVMAVALNRRVLGRNLMRSVFYLPAVLASIAIATMWRWIYNPTMGLVNSVLNGVGLEGWTRQWLGDPDLAIYSIFVAFVWQIAGFNMVLFLAGLQTVPNELLDAARVDGASRWQTFWNVTIPALRPTIAVVLVLTIISSLKVFGGCPEFRGTSVAAR